MHICVYIYVYMYMYICKRPTIVSKETYCMRNAAGPVLLPDEENKTDTQTHRHTDTQTHL